MVLDNIDKLHILDNIDNLFILDNFFFIFYILLKNLYKNI